MFRTSSGDLYERTLCSSVVVDPTHQQQPISNTSSFYSLAGCSVHRGRPSVIGKGLHSAIDLALVSFISGPKSFTFRAWAWVSLGRLKGGIQSSRCWSVCSWDHPIDGCITLAVVDKFEAGVEECHRAHEPSEDPPDTGE